MVEATRRLVQQGCAGRPSRCMCTYAAVLAQGMTVLSGRRQPILNDFLGFTVKAYLRASGRTGQYKTTISDVGLEQAWVVR